MTTVWHVFESGHAVGDLWIPLCSPEHRKRRFAQAAWPEGVSKTKMFLSSFFISDVYCSGNGFSFFGHAAWSWIREEKRWCKSLRVSPPFSRSAFLRHRSLPKARAKAEAQGRRDPVEVIWLLKIRVSLSIIFYWVQLWANGTTHLVMFIFSNQFFWSQSFWIIAICILWWVGRTTLSVELGGSSCIYGILTLKRIFCGYHLFYISATRLSSQKETWRGQSQSDRLGVFIPQMFGWSQRITISKFSLALVAWLPWRWSCGPCGPWFIFAQLMRHYKTYLLPQHVEVSPCANFWQEIWWFPKLCSAPRTNLVSVLLQSLLTMVTGKQPKNCWSMELYWLLGR